MIDYAAMNAENHRNESRGLSRDEMDRLIAAAFSDMVLYRIDPDDDIDTDSFVAVDPHTGGQRALIQVWPEDSR